MVKVCRARGKGGKEAKEENAGVPKKYNISCISKSMLQLLNERQQITIIIIMNWKIKNVRKLEDHVRKLETSLKNR